MFCTKCGAQIDDDAKFCKICGTKTHIGEEAVSTVEAVATSSKIEENTERLDAVRSDENPDYEASMHDVSGSSELVKNQLERVRMMIEDGDFDAASIKLEQIIEAENENAEAYFLKTLVDFKVKSIDEISNEQLSGNENFAKALQYASADERNAWGQSAAQVTGASEGTATKTVKVVTVKPQTPPRHNLAEDFKKKLRSLDLAEAFDKLSSFGGKIAEVLGALALYVIFDWAICYWTAIAILVFASCGYLWYLLKFFFTYFEDRNKHRKAEHTISVPRTRKIFNVFGGIVLIAFVIVSVYAFNRVSSDLSPDVVKVRMSNLTQFDSSRTINDVFNRFFADTEWNRYETGSNTYVEFSGICMFNGKRARARITFELDGDMFSVDTIKIDGTSLGIFQNAFLEDVYDEASSNNYSSRSDWIYDLLQSLNDFIRS
jgi:hypothetical protein